MKERGELTEKSKHLNTSQESEATTAGQYGVMGSTLVNLCVLLGFAAFAYTVKCVLRAVENS